MSDSFELKQFDRLALVVGPSAALRLAAFFGSRSLFIPRAIPDGHILVRLLGREASNQLQANYAGQTFSIPSCELNHLRLAGKIHAVAKYQVPTKALALVVGVTPKRVAQLQDQLRREGYDGLIGDLSEIPDHA